MTTKKKFKRAKLTKEQEDQIMAQAVMRALNDRVGGREHFYVVRDKSGAAVDAAIYDRKVKTPCGRGAYRSGLQVLHEFVDFVAHEDAFREMHRLSPGSPGLSAQMRLKRGAIDLLTSICGRGEEAMDDFDTYNYEPAPGEPLHRSRWSNYGVTEVYQDAGRYFFETGKDNDPAFKLRGDVRGVVAGDEEFRENLLGGVALLNVYFPNYRSPNGSLLLQSMGLEPITATPPDTWTGNYSLDIDVFHKADGFTPADIKPAVLDLGTGVNGKSAKIQLWGACLGPGVMDIGLESAAITTGTETCFGQRLLDARRRMSLCRIGAGQDSIKNGLVDSRFMKGATSVEELVEIGGLYVASRMVNLRGSYEFASNFVLRTNDPSLGTDRRLQYLRFTEDFTKKALTKAELLGMFEPYMPTLRRLVLEAVRFRVEAQSCRKREPHPFLDKDTEAFRQAAEWSFLTNLKRSLRRVK